MARAQRSSTEAKIDLADLDPVTLDRLKQELRKELLAEAKDEIEAQARAKVSSEMREKMLDEMRVDAKRKVNAFLNMLAERDGADHLMRRLEDKVNHKNSLAYLQDRFPSAKLAKNGSDMSMMGVLSTVVHTLSGEYLTGVLDPATGRLAGFGFVPKPEGS